MTLLYILLLLFIMFLVYSSLIFDIVLVNDGYMHMFVDSLVLASRELSYKYYVSMVLRYYLFANALYILRRGVDRRGDIPVESFVVLPECIDTCRTWSRRRGRFYILEPSLLMFLMHYDSDLAML